MGIDGAAARVTSASTNGANADTLGGVGGTETHTLTTAESPAHTHTTGDSLTGAASINTFAITGAGSITNVSGSTGGGGAHSNTQPWIAGGYVIRY